MARKFDTSSGDQYGQANSASPVTTLPLCVSVWVRVPSAPASIETFFYYGKGSNTTVYFDMEINASGQIYGWARFAGGSVTSSAGKDDDKWHHVLWATWYDSGVPIYRHRMWVDASFAGNSTTGTGDISTFDRIAVGMARDVTPSQAFNGMVADVAIANFLPSVYHAKALYYGKRPQKVFGNSLKAFHPMDGLTSPEPDLGGSGYDLTLTGPPTKADHAPVRPYTPPWAATLPLIGTAAACGHAGPLVNSEILKTKVGGGLPA